MNRAMVEDALPRTAEAISKLRPVPAIPLAAEERRITEVVHFTMTRNLIGVLSTALMCRSRVGKEHYVQAVYAPNCYSRVRDAAWIDYVNLSVSRINRWMFGYSRGWHPREAWAILGFDVAILGHPGVVFTTTNNAYEDVCLRGEGLEGFEQIFLDPVVGYDGRLRHRVGLEDKFPTDFGAEILYPSSLSIDYLQTIYTESEEGIDIVEGILGGLHSEIDVEVVLDSERFRP
jgi:hypothetical protein